MPADTSLTKNAHQKERFTEEQVNDILLCTDPEIGYLHFATKFFYIQHPVKGRMLFKPYDYQLGLLNSYNSYTRSINLQPRQSGKCLINKTKIKIKHKITGEIKEITIGEFYEMQKARSA
jgi:hypothetical protein